jgi:hypothetical protein
LSDSDIGAPSVRSHFRWPPMFNLCLRRLWANVCQVWCVNSVCVILCACVQCVQMSDSDIGAPSVCSHFRWPPMFNLCLRRLWANVCQVWCLNSVCVWLYVHVSNVCKCRFLTSVRQVCVWSNNPVGQTSKQSGSYAIPPPNQGYWVNVG